MSLAIGIWLVIANEKSEMHSSARSGLDKKEMGGKRSGKDGKV